MIFSSSSWSKTNLLTSGQNDADGYNRVIGIAQLKAFSCAKNATAKTSFLGESINNLSF